MPRLVRFLVATALAEGTTYWDLTDDEFRKHLLDANLVSKITSVAAALPADSSIVASEQSVKREALSCIIRLAAHGIQILLTTRDCK